MKVNTIHVESLSTNRNAPTLAQKIEQEVDKFVQDHEGELVNYVLSGTTLGQGSFGQALVTIHWHSKTEDESKPKKK